MPQKNVSASTFAGGRPAALDSRHMPAHPLGEVLHRRLQWELRLEAERALGTAQVRVIVAVRSDTPVPAGASNFTLAPGATAWIAAAISAGVVIAPIVRLNTR